MCIRDRSRLFKKEMGINISCFIKNIRMEKEMCIRDRLGTEGDGLASDTIAETDATVLIPMTHGVDSLNVAAASAVAFWELAGRR